MRLVLWGVLGALLFPAFTVVADPVRQLQRADRWEISWAAPAATYLHYAVSAQERVAPTNPPPEGAKLIEPALGYAHFFVHELSPLGDLMRQATPLPLEEALLQPALHAPTGKQKAGFSWPREWSFEVWDYPALSLTSTYTIKGLEVCGNAECVAIEGKHTRKPPAKAEDEGKTRWLNFELQTTAWFHPESRRLQAALMELHASLARDKDRDEFHWRVRFELKRELDSTEERNLHSRVARAIDKGVERMWALLRRDGTWKHDRWHRGGNALALLTQLMCDVPRDDPRINQAFERLADMKMENTYSVACSLMAYEARYISEEERRAYVSNADPPEFKRELSPADRAEMERLVQWLKDNQNETNPFYNYSRGAEDDKQRFDFSNTQYALLGLAAAQRCKVRIPPGIVRPLIEELIKYQQQQGPKVKRVIGYKPPERDKERGTHSTRVSEARGWTYRTQAKWSKYEETDSYGSMTTAGLTCLLAAIDIAQSMSAPDFAAEFGNQATHSGWEKRANESVEGGMAWMEHWFSVTRNPNKARHWYLYYMYGLERIMMMAGQRWLGMHNWYNEGASVLIVTQDENGGWGDLAETCFALLFLKKGTVPSRRKVTTGDK